VKDESGIIYSQALSFYKNLTRTLMHKGRFFLNEHRFLIEIEKHLDRHIHLIKKGEIVYRARLVDATMKNNYKREESFRGLSKKHSFVPPKKFAKEGRASSAGIVYLYVAESEHTAIAEVRPTMRSRVNVAPIEALQDLRLLDLSFNFPVEPALPYKGSHVFAILANEFMIPLDIKASNGGYLPTQFITEFIRKHKSNFDGIRYNSSLNMGGKNLVIFNHHKCKAISSDFFDIYGIEYCAIGQTGERQIIEGERLQQSREYQTLSAAGKLIVFDEELY